MLNQCGERNESLSSWERESPGEPWHYRHVPSGLHGRREPALGCGKGQECREVMGFAQCGAIMSPNQTSLAGTTVINWDCPRQIKTCGHLIPKLSSVFISIPIVLTKTEVVSDGAGAPACTFDSCFGDNFQFQEASLGTGPHLCDCIFGSFREADLASFYCRAF